MDLNEDDLSKKILNSFKISGYRTLSDTGFEEVSHIHLTQPYRNYEIKTKNRKLICADNHIVFLQDYKEIMIKNILPGQKIITEDGPEEVLSISKSHFKSSMFDITVDHPNHRFYSNGILSHNTITSAITILHFVLFNNNKNVLVTANKLDTATEILDKIKEIYQRLPFFLQQGIRKWNEKFMSFENKSRVK